MWKSYCLMSHGHRLKDSGDNKSTTYAKQVEMMVSIGERFKLPVHR